jgi:hypothetical protein
MTDLFDDEEKIVVEDDVNPEDALQEPPMSDARRRLEQLMEERRLREELKDSFDDY